MFLRSWGTVWERWVKEGKPDKKTASAALLLISAATSSLLFLTCCHLIIPSVWLPVWASTGIKLVLSLISLSLFLFGFRFYVEGEYIIRDYRRHNNLCEWCGYNLQSSPNKCPECGALPDRH
jgi:Ni/Co efflux regulator RcnB